MDGCIYRTKDGECNLYAEGGKYKAFCDMDGCKGRKMSNADRIRAMNDEELAILCENGCPPKYPCPDFEEEEIGRRRLCQRCWLDWLKKEVEDE